MHWEIGPFESITNQLVHVGAADDGVQRYPGHARAAGQESQQGVGNRDAGGPAMHANDETWLYIKIHMSPAVHSPM